MKTALSAAIALTVLLAGCATGPASTQVASTSSAPATECKLQPMQTATLAYGKKRPVNDLDRAQAVSDLSRSEARLSQLRGTMGQSGLYEELLRDCNR